MSEGALARAARLFALRSRHRGAGIFAGHYASAFRGGGLEFEESRPYVPGEDVRSIDWNATARSGEPYVKHFREQRDRAVLLLLDVGAAMAFGPPERSKATAAAEFAALLAAAAARSGDRVGLCAFSNGLRCSLAPGRGEDHALRVMDAAFAAAAAPEGPSQLAGALEHAEQALGRTSRRGGLVIALSGHGAFADAEGRVPPGFAELAARHELIALGLLDPRERALPRAGRIALVDAAQRTNAIVLDTGRRRAADRFQTSVRTRCDRVRREVRRAGGTLHWMQTERDPLAQLLELFADRRRSVRERSGV